MSHSLSSIVIITCWGFTSFAVELVLVVVDVFALAPCVCVDCMFGSGGVVEIFVVAERSGCELVSSPIVCSWSPYIMYLLFYFVVIWYVI